VGRQSFLVEVVIALKNNATAGLNEFKRGFANAANIPANFNDMMGRAGVALGNFTAQIPAMVGDLLRLGVESETTTRRFEQFAGGSERATVLLEAFRRGADGTIDKLSGMEAAARLLQMGLVGNADEMENVTAMAVKLGNQTMSAGDRIGDFAALLANQSIPRLDNFGISSGKVRKRINELLESGQALSREDAFKMAVMEEGAKALDTLGDTADLTSAKLDKLSAGFQDAKVGAGEFLLEVGENLLNALFDTDKGIDELASRLRNFGSTLKETAFLGELWWKTAVEIDQHGGKWAETQEKVARQMLATRGELETQTDAMKEAFAQYEDLDGIGEQYRRTMEGETDTTALFTDETQTLGQELKRLRMAELGAASAATKLAEKQAEAVKQLVETKRFALESSMAFTDFFRSSKEAAERHATSVEELEQQHQAKVAEIMERGKTRYVKIDVESARLEMRILKARLEQARTARQKFDGETTELERLRNRQSIKDLQESIAEKTAVLGRANKGWIAIAGESTGAMLAQEELAYQEEKTALEEARAEQERIQRESFGRMILQQFTAWATMKGIAADRSIEMQISLAERFGLIDEEAATFARNMITEFETWATGTGKSADAVAQKLYDLKFGFAEFKNALENIPTDIDVNVRLNTIGEIHQAASYGGAPVPELMQQHGGQTMVGPGFGGPMRFMAGEGASPEVVTVQPMSQDNRSVRFGDVNINNGMDEAMLAALVSRAMEDF